MLSPLLSSLLAGLAVSTIAFVGFGSLYMARKKLAVYIKAIVAFAAGGLLGGALLHLLPESLEQGGPVFEMTLMGIAVFFILDSLIWVYHCHGGHQLHDDAHAHGSCPTKPVGALNLIGDALHNITDGIVVASAFIAGGPALGIPTTIAVALHEIPQEVGDFGILVYSGFSRLKALFWNGVVALTILVGVGITFLAEPLVDGLTRYTLPFAAGGFLYMACTNLLSEIKEEPKLGTRALQFVLFAAGVALLWVTAMME
ncbi:MAG: hypothetical protein RL141_522 [Candidatus Parcubacteria bacterium]|jgi:zinc and cadmium transporter